MPGKTINIYATARAGSPPVVSMNTANSNFGWTLRGFYIQFAATFTDICTVSYHLRHHEGSKYDVVMYAATVATTAAVVQTHIYNPTVPLHFGGKDRCMIQIGGASSANQFNYVAVLQED